MASSGTRPDQQKDDSTMKIDTLEAGLERDFEILTKFPAYILDRLAGQGSCDLDTLVKAVPTETEMARIHFVTDSIDRLQRYGLISTERSGDAFVIKPA